MHLREIRKQLGWSFSEMAELLNLKRSTYQHYDEGRRETPPEVLKLAQESLEKVSKHSIMLKERYKEGGEAEQEINRLYPRGIISEI